jgi:hypothetical protein
MSTLQLPVFLPLYPQASLFSEVVGIPSVAHLQKRVFQGTGGGSELFLLSFHKTFGIVWFSFSNEAGRQLRRSRFHQCLTDRFNCRRSSRLEPSGINSAGDIFRYGDQFRFRDKAVYGSACWDCIFESSDSGGRWCYKSCVSLIILQTVLMATSMSLHRGREQFGKAASICEHV